MLGQPVGARRTVLTKCDVTAGHPPGSWAAAAPARRGRAARWPRQAGSGARCRTIFVGHRSFSTR